MTVRKKANKQGGWHVYILRCADNSLYTGITTNLSRRVDEHNLSPKGASYTRGRRPVCLVFTLETDNRASASRLEIKIKRLTRSAKQNLITEYQSGNLKTLDSMS